MERVCRVVLASTVLALSWLGMMAIHEMGHVLHAYASGGRVSRVVLYPRAISRTELSTNPFLLFVAWGGVVWGSALPAMPFFLVRVGSPEVRHLVAFFAGFCLVANGAYLVAGLASGAGDPGDLLRLGASPASVLITGVLAFAFGLTLWHRLGPRCGFAVHRAPRLFATTAVMLSLLSACVAVEVLFVPQ